MSTVSDLIAVIALLFIGTLSSTLMGGVVGWIVELAFPFVNTTLNQIAQTQLTGFETGAVLGFFGSFFRSSLSTKS